MYFFIFCLFFDLLQKSVKGSKVGLFPNYAGMDYNRTDELRLAENSENLHNLEIISPACIIPA